jgi:hypothetical protein
LCSDVVVSAATQRALCNIIFLFGAMEPALLSVGSAVAIRPESEQWLSQFFVDGEQRNVWKPVTALTNSALNEFCDGGVVGQTIKVQHEKYWGDADYRVSKIEFDKKCLDIVIFVEVKHQDVDYMMEFMRESYCDEYDPLGPFDIEAASSSSEAASSTSGAMTNKVDKKPAAMTKKVYKKPAAVTKTVYKKPAAVTKKVYKKPAAVTKKVYKTPATLIKGRQV